MVTESDAQHLTSPGAMLGTVAYMSPEQVKVKELDARTDLFSFGAVLYEMVTSKIPFDGDSPSEICSAILRDEPSAPSQLNLQVSPGLEAVICKALEKDRNLRYQSAAEMRADLQRLKRDTESAKTAIPQEVAIAQLRATRRRALITGAIVVLALAGGYIGFRWLRQRSAPAATVATTKPSIAVLPLQNMSGDPNNDYFSDGMTEEIITKLSRIESLEVASRTSTADLRGTQKDVKELGRELGVRYLLDGSVRRSGERVRITARLIDASTGFHVWAEDFDRNVKDVFAVQEETALKIAAALNLHLSPQEQQAVQHRYTQNPQAYDAYLRGQALAWNWDNPEKLEAARKEFEKALQFDPNYPLALAGLSRVENFYYRNVDSNKTHLLRSEELAQRALAIDPQVAEAHVSLALVLANRFDYVGAAAEAREATRLEPENAQAWVCLSWALGYEQPPDATEAEKAAREAIRLQPSVWGSYYQLGRALLLQRRFPEAIAAMQQANELSHGSSTPDMGLAQIYLAQGNPDRALGLLTKLPTARSGNNLFWLSAAYAAHGDRDKAMGALQKAFDGGFRDFAALDNSPYFSSLRSDPRFQQLIQRYRR